MHKNDWIESIQKKKEIKLEDEKFTGQLVVEDYPELKSFYLQNIKNVDKVVLKSLTKLQECTIWDCGTKELVIENCPQIKKLNVRKNSLTGLEFLKGLENLEELELDGNIELSKMLEPYRKTIQRSNENVQVLEKEKSNLSVELEISQQKYDELKKFLKETFTLLSQETKQELVDELNKEIKRKDSDVALGRTEELILNTKELIKSIREIKQELEKELSELKGEKQELEVGLIKEKKDQLEKLKNEFIEKRLGRLVKKREKIKNSLEVYLASVEELLLNPNHRFYFTTKKDKEEYLLRGKSELTELLKKLTEKQKEITRLEIKNQTTKELESQISQNQIVVKETREESTNQKALVNQTKKDKFIVGFPTPLGFAGISGERDRSRLEINEKILQKTQEVVGLEQKIIKQQLEVVQEKGEQNQQPQIEQLPK